MTSTLRKPLFIAHVTTSIGWLGAVATFLALSVIGLHSVDAATVRGTYLVMEPAAWYVLVPLAGATLLTGVVQTATSQWRLLRHYWLLFKLVIAVFITIVLLLYMQTFAVLARAAADDAVPLDTVRSASPLIHAALALLSLLIASVLGVYKPRGHVASTPRWAKIFGSVLLVVIGLFLVLLAARGPGGHGPGRHFGAAIDAPAVAAARALMQALDFPATGTFNLPVRWNDDLALKKFNGAHHEYRHTRRSVWRAAEDHSLLRGHRPHPQAGAAAERLPRVFGDRWARAALH